MDNRAVSWLMCAIDLISVAAVILIGAVVIPGLQAQGKIPTYSTLGYALGAIPLLICAAVGFKLFVAIGKGDVFSYTNARLLTYMGASSAVSALVWLVELGYLILARIATQTSVVSTLCVALIASVALASSCAALSLLCKHAADIKSENDMTV